MGLSSAVIVGYFRATLLAVDRRRPPRRRSSGRAPAVLQGQVDRLEVEVDRQGVGQRVDGPRQLRADAVAQQFGDLVRRSHDRQDSLWFGPRSPAVRGPRPYLEATDCTGEDRRASNPWTTSPEVPAATGPATSPRPPQGCDNGPPKLGRTFGIPAMTTAIRNPHSPRGLDPGRPASVDQGGYIGRVGAVNRPMSVFHVLRSSAIRRAITPRGPPHQAGEFDVHPGEGPRRLADVDLVGLGRDGGLGCAD